jgi:hypothetical protein
MDPQVTFNEARHGLLEALANEEGWSLLLAVQAYNTNTEFRRRIDIAALSLCCPSSETIH